MDLTLETPVRFIPKVGPVMAERLGKLGITTAGDMLHHIPFRYDDFSKISPIRQIRPGDTVTIRGTIDTFSAFVTKNGKRLQEAKVSDQTGKISVIWFNQPFLRSIMKPGTPLHLSGTVSWFGTSVVLNSPQYEIISDESSMSLHTGRLVPVYPETAGVSSKWLRGRIHAVLSVLDTMLADPLPADIISEFQLPRLSEAISSIHFPAKPEGIETARRRLAFDELFLLQLTAYFRKRERIRTAKAHPFTIHRAKLNSLIRSLPFTLTSDQSRAIEDILTDISSGVPMNRLLEGDVGSGKTVVAAIALYEAVLNGTQAVLLAPTQILAQQHFESIARLLNPAGVHVSLVTGTTKEKKTSEITIGTHALLSDRIRFPNLGLIVIDEQHRFGVKQRSFLTAESATHLIPHLLTMTATPIPRTLAKTVFGNIDLSRLTEMPSGRKRVKTWVVGEEKRNSAYAWISKKLNESGSQAFIICPLIEDSEALEDVKAVKSEYERLKTIFPHHSLGLLHGKLKPNEKTKVLNDFRNKVYDILVSTPVVEVGIDIPNAAVMVIEASQRFGLGQLHQLRGRVGRGSLESYCILFCAAQEGSSYERLKAMETIFDGAVLAETDLRLRGPGDVFGSRQHGAASLKLADFMDATSVHETFEAVSSVTAADPDLTNLPHLRELIKKSKIDTIDQD